MKESITVSLNKDGDTVTITTEPGRGGLLLPKEGLLQMLSLFIGNRDVFYRPQTTQEHAPQPEDLIRDWASEMARHFGVASLAPFEIEATDCPECGRLVGEPGLCGPCADEKAGFRR